jgi:hypothetical protein
MRGVSARLQHSPIVYLLAVGHVFITHRFPSAGCSPPRRMPTALDPRARPLLFIRSIWPADVPVSYLNFSGRQSASPSATSTSSGRQSASPSATSTSSAAAPIRLPVSYLNFFRWPDRSARQLPQLLPLANRRLAIGLRVGNIHPFVACPNRSTPSASPPTCPRVGGLDRLEASRSSSPRLRGPLQEIAHIDAALRLPASDNNPPIEFIIGSRLNTCRSNWKSAYPSRQRRLGSVFASRILDIGYRHKFARSLRISIARGRSGSGFVASIVAMVPLPPVKT